MNQTYGKQSTFGSILKEFYVKYKLYILITVVLVVGAAIAVLALSGDKSSTEQSSQLQSTASEGQNTAKEIEPLSKQSGKSSGKYAKDQDVNDDTTSDEDLGDSNESVDVENSGQFPIKIETFQEISDASSAKQSVNGNLSARGTSGLPQPAPGGTVSSKSNNPPSKTNQFFGGSSNLKPNSNAQGNPPPAPPAPLTFPVSPPSPYNTTERNPILEVSDASSSTFFNAIKSNSNWIMHALYLGIKKSKHYPNVSTDCFLQLLENVTPINQTDFCSSINSELFSYHLSSKPEIAKIWGSSAHNVSKIVANLKTIKNVCSAESRKSEFVDYFVKKKRGYSGCKLTSIDFNSIWFNYLLPTEMDKDEDFMVLKTFYNNVDTSLLKSFDKFYSKFSADFFFKECSSVGDSELIKMYFECRPEEIKNLTKVDYESLKFFISDDKIDIEIRKNFINVLSGKNLAPLLFTVRFNNALFALVHSVSAYPAQFPIDNTLPSIINIAISNDMTSLQTLIADSIKSNTSSVDDSLKSQIISKYIEGWKGKSSDRNLLTSLQMLYDKGILTLSAFLASVPFTRMEQSQHFIFENLATDSSSAYKLLNKYSGNSSNDKLIFSILFKKIMDKNLLDNYFNLLFDRSAYWSEEEIQKIDAKNKFILPSDCNVNDSRWKKFIPFTNMPNLKATFHSLLTATGIINIETKKILEYLVDQPDLAGKLNELNDASVLESVLNIVPNFISKCTSEGLQKFGNFAIQLFLTNSSKWTRLNSLWDRNFQLTSETVISLLNENIFFDNFTKRIIECKPTIKDKNEIKYLLKTNFSKEFIVVATSNEFKHDSDIKEIVIKKNFDYHLIETLEFALSSLDKLSKTRQNIFWKYFEKNCPLIGNLSLFDAGKLKFVVTTFLDSDDSKIENILKSFKNFSNLEGFFQLLLEWTKDSKFPLSRAVLAELIFQKENVSKTEAVIENGDKSSIQFKQVLSDCFSTTSNHWLSLNALEKIKSFDHDLYYYAFHHAIFDANTKLNFKDDDDLIKIILGCKNSSHLAKILEVESLKAQLEKIWFNKDTFSPQFLVPPFLVILKEYLSYVDITTFKGYCELGSELENGKYFNYFCPGNNMYAIRDSFKNYLTILGKADKVDREIVRSCLKEIGSFVTSERAAKELCEFAINQSIDGVSIDSNTEETATAILHPHDRFIGVLNLNKYLLSNLLSDLNRPGRNHIKPASLTLCTAIAESGIYSKLDEVASLCSIGCDSKDDDIFKALCPVSPTFPLDSLSISTFISVKLPAKPQGHWLAILDFIKKGLINGTINLCVRDYFKIGASRNIEAITRLCIWSKNLEMLFDSSLSTSFKTLFTTPLTDSYVKGLLGELGNFFFNQYSDSSVYLSFLKTLCICNNETFKQIASVAILKKFKSDGIVSFIFSNLKDLDDFVHTETVLNELLKWKESTKESNLQLLCSESCGTKSFIQLITTNRDLLANCLPIESFQKWIKDLFILGAAFPNKEIILDEINSAQLITSQNSYVLFCAFATANSLNEPRLFPIRTDPILDSKFVSDVLKYHWNDKFVNDSLSILSNELSNNGSLSIKTRMEFCQVSLDTERDSATSPNLATRVFSELCPIKDEWFDDTNNDIFNFVQSNIKSYNSCHFITICDRMIKEFINGKCKDKFLKTVEYILKSKDDSKLQIFLLLSGQPHSICDSGDFKSKLSKFKERLTNFNNNPNFCKIYTRNPENSSVYLTNCKLGFEQGNEAFQAMCPFIPEKINNLFISWYSSKVTEEKYLYSTYLSTNLYNWFNGLLSTDYDKFKQVENYFTIYFGGTLKGNADLFKATLSDFNVSFFKNAKVIKQYFSTRKELENSDANLPNDSVFKDFEVQVLEKLKEPNVELEAYINFFKYSTSNCNSVFNELFNDTRNLERAFLDKKFKDWIKSNSSKSTAKSDIVWAKLEKLMAP